MTSTWRWGRSGTEVRSRRGPLRAIHEETAPHLVRLIVGGMVGIGLQVTLSAVEGHHDSGLQLSLAWQSQRQ